MRLEIKAAIAKGELILFLGSGASKTSSDSSGNPLLDGSALAARLAEEASLAYSDEPLDVVYSAARLKLENRIDSIIERLYRFTTPSREYATLATHAWRRIYTLNIDDALDRALSRHSKQNIAHYIAADSLRERDQVFRRLDYVKLNGSVDRLRDGIIFSPSEYAQATVQPMPWYEEVAADMLRVPILFIGTKVDEPLLKFHIERYKQFHRKRPGIGFVITPGISEIQRLDFQAYNLTHIAGTLATFTTWLEKEFAPPLTDLDLAKASIPQLAELLASPDQAQHAALFERVTHVNASTLRTGASPIANAAILPFYKGFKPSWADIVHAVPAELESLAQFVSFIRENRTPGKLIPLIGPAGSGKTTLLMQAALKLSAFPSTAVYFIAEPIKTLKATLEALDQSTSSDSVVVIIDKVDFVAHELAEILQAQRLQRTTLVAGERQGIWHKRTKRAVGPFATRPYEVSEFTRKDAANILEKLSQYGAWTRLGQMSPKQRVSELLDRAQKQLLIALLEATSGRGFEEIIEDEYGSLTDDAERLFFVLVGLASIHRLPMPIALADRALVQMSLAGGVSELSPALSGIVTADADRLLARHPVYVRHLLDRVIDPKLVARSIRGLLKAFALNKAPVIQNIPRLDAAIYKATINHRFLFEVLKGRQELVVELYDSLSKRFELDGLFWLQYGLCLRDFEKHAEALEKLRNAVAAYSMDHTKHALAQQLLIMAEQAPNKQVAMDALHEAREILSILDRTITQSDDTYPIVTLAEGHTRVMRVWEPDSSRQIAAQYANLVQKRSEGDPGNERVRACWERLFKYASVGTWSGESANNSEEPYLPN